MPADPVDDDPVRTPHGGASGSGADGVVAGTTGTGDAAVRGVEIDGLDPGRTVLNDIASSDIGTAHAQRSQTGREWLTRLGGWLLPPRCLICGEAGHGGHDLCAPCLHTLPWNRSACARCALPLPAVPGTDPAAPQLCGHCLRRPPPFARAHASFIYAAPLDRLLPRLKFHADLAAGQQVARLMLTVLATVERPQALIPVPLHPARLRTRGYDQALELARPLARGLGLPLLADTLHRARATAPQSDLGAAARRRNLRGAFALVPGAATRILPAHVALIDDVMTTGTTLAEAARTLHRAGVARVDVWVAARVPKPR